MGNVDLLEDACSKISHSRRAMFGGHGFFAPNGGMFAGIVTNDEIMLKFADGTARAELEALGGHAWVYNGKMTMKEWIVIPDRFYDEPQELAAWAKRAHQLVPGKPLKVAKGAKGAKPTGAKGGKPGPGTKPGVSKGAKPAATISVRGAPAKKTPSRKAVPKAKAPTRAAKKKTAGKNSKRR